jgi:hypothetical protein
MPYASELITGEAIDKDIHVRSAIAKLLMDYQPDIIQIEQGFAYLGLKPVLRDLGMKPKIIFSSQNVEYIMKKSIYRELGAPSKTIKSLVSKTRELESELCKTADLVIAVSEHDAKIQRAMGAKSVVVAPNGIDKITVPVAELKYWRSFKEINKIKKMITFVGSGHPPNWVGFIEMIGLDTTDLPSDSRLLIAGGVADYFNDSYQKSENQKFWRRVTTVGRLSDNRLGGLLRESDILILPITSGGGSNLKTAEAILSGKKVVGTHYAFRGFEKYKGLPNIYLADNKVEFKQSILKALESPYVKPSASEAALAEHVEWRYCLMTLLPELKKLSRRASMSKLWKSVKKPGRKAKSVLARAK